MGNKQSLLDRYLEYRIRMREMKESRRIESGKLDRDKYLRKMDYKETKRREKQAKKSAKKQAKETKKLVKKNKPRRVSTSTKFVFFFILPVIFLILLVGTSFIFGELQLFIPIMISLGIVIVLTASALKETTTYPNFFIKRILGVYERKGYSLHTYVLDKESIKNDVEIPYYKGGLAFVWFWEEIVPVFGGEEKIVREIKDVLYPNDGVSIRTNLGIATSFSPNNMSETLRKCGKVEKEVTKEHLKTVSDLFFNMVEPEFKATIKDFASTNKNSTYETLINSTKTIATDLKNNVEALTDVQGTVNGAHLVEKFGIIVSDYNPEMRPDAKVEEAKEGITIARMNKEAALNEIAVKKDVLVAIGTAIKETTGDDPSQEAMGNLALSMFGNSNNVLFMGNSGGKNPAVAINTNNSKKGGPKP